MTRSGPSSDSWPGADRDGFAKKAEAVILVGIQASGKTTFYQQQLSATHCHISLDVSKTRARELARLQWCLENNLDFVVDNTNATADERRRFIVPAKAAGYRLVGYYFEPDVAGCLKRNAARPVHQRIPIPGLFGTKKRLEPPAFNEGFDALFEVRIDDNGRFDVHPLIAHAPS